MLDRRTVLATAKVTLAADFACDEAAFDRDGVFLVEAPELPGRRRFPVRSKTRTPATMGRGVVVTCSVDGLPSARAHLDRRRHDDLFSISTLASIAAFIEGDGQFLAGPDLKYLCASGTLRPVPTAIIYGRSGWMCSLTIKAVVSARRWSAGRLKLFWPRVSLPTTPLK